MNSFPSALLAASALLAGPVVAANIIANGDFSDGLTGWSTNHPWYAQPKEAGLSTIGVDPAGREGPCLKMTGQGKRGIAIQNVAAFPGSYRVGAWVRAEALAGTRGGILVEWFDRDGKYLRGDWAVEVTGTGDWQRQEKVLIAPPGTRRVHFDLLTDQPNQGTLWLDDITMERLPGSGPPPTPPRLTVGAARSEGELLVHWDPATLTPDTVRLAIYADQQPLTTTIGRTPTVVAEALDAQATLMGLTAGATWHVAAVALDADGRLSGLGPAVSGTAGGELPPRPGWPTAERLPNGRLRLGWSPHLLDRNLVSVRFVVPAREGRNEQLLAELPLAAADTEPRPLFCTAPWVSCEAAAPEGLAEVGARAVGPSGPGELASTAVWSAPAESTGPWRLWTAGPTLQLPRSAPPAESAGGFDLVVRRGEAEGRQLFLRPAAPVHHLRVQFSDLLADGGSRIGSHWLAYHFVNYVRIEKNSRATPPGELLWPAPADYPDELADDLARDLPAEQVQPIYIRLTVPPTAAPGRYRGTVVVEAAEGRQTVPIEVRVASAPPPGPERFTFVYWYSWDQACKQFGVQRASADGWRVLEHLAAMMKTYHQNSVVVPWHLVKAWQRADGQLQYDWTEFDRYLTVMRQAGVDRLFCMAHVGARTTGDWTCPTMAAHRVEVRRLETLETVRVSTLELLPAVEEHVAALGLLDRFAVHVADEPIAENVESYRQLSAEVRRRAPRLRRIDAIHVPQLSGSLEVWVPQINYFEKWLTEFRAAQQAGNELWFYVAWVPQGAYTNRMIDSSAIKPRLLHWLNALYGTQGYLHWALNHWQVPLTSLESPGDQYICWPSRRFVANSSLRYEAERDGMEEAELLAELDGAGTPAERSNGVVTDFTHYTRSWEELEQARRRLLAALEDRHRPAGIAAGETP